MEISYDDYDFDDEYERDEPEAERDEWVLVCGYPGCCMPGYHFRSECHNAEDIMEYEGDQPQCPTARTGA